MTPGVASVAAIAVFVTAYGLVIAEEFTQIRKSKPVVVAAGLIWILVAVALRGSDPPAADILRHNLLDYGELLLFLLAAMTYVNTLAERNVFAALRTWLLARRLSLRALFLLTGVLSFFLSAVLDNLTTALVMGAVVISVGRGNARFIVPGCVSVVVAANAGGAFCPFGDITTLMAWQAGKVHFFEFFDLFLPSLVNWALPALCMLAAIPAGHPEPDPAPVAMKYGARGVILLFALTIALTVTLHQVLHLPPFLGMMTGLGLLQVFGYVIRRQEFAAGIGEGRFDIFISMKRVDWDTLLFFYGVVLCVGGLGALGYLATLSQHSYQSLGPTAANVLVGLVSAVVDNIPVMFAVLNMNPDMPLGQWLLVTLTAGVGGSLLSIGSAAGVALMGQARGTYTFMAHLRWSWAVALGYAASILVHLGLNSRLF